MFDYSKCTYKELNSMLTRFRRNKPDYLYGKTESEALWKYSDLATEECCKIEMHLAKGKYIDMEDRILYLRKRFRDYYNTFDLENSKIVYEKKDRFKRDNKRRFLLKRRV